MSGSGIRRRSFMHPARKSRNCLLRPAVLLPSPKIGGVESTHGDNADWNREDAKRRPQPALWLGPHNDKTPGQDVVKTLLLGGGSNQDDSGKRRKCRGDSP